MQELVYKYFVTLERQRILLCAALIVLKCAEKWGINNIFCQLKIQSPVIWRWWMETNFGCYEN